MSEIVVRKVKFEFPDELDDVLPGDDPGAETYLVAFSLTIPYLEPYLIRTYRAIVDKITDQALAEDVRGFIAQEVPTQGEKARPRVPSWFGDGKRRYFRTFAPSYHPGKLDVDPLVEAVLIPYTPT